MRAAAWGCLAIIVGFGVTIGVIALALTAALGAG